MSNESHLDKIKKLLRLSKSPNVHEAEIAMQRAMELAAKHGVDASALGDEFADITHRFLPMSKRLSREWRYAIATCREYFQITPCIDRCRGAVVFIGREEAITAAEYVVQFLVRSTRDQVKRFTVAEKAAKRRMTGGKRSAFIAGFFTGVQRQLERGMRDLNIQQSSLAIVLADERTRREDLMAKIMGKTTMTESKQPRRSNATWAGMQAGRETQIHKPLSGREDHASLGQSNLLLH